MIKEKAREFSKEYRLKVFPLVGKKPIIKDRSWKDYASTDVDRFSDSLWNAATGYGVVLSGHTVFDIDHRNISAEQLPPLEKTLIVQTFNGYHFYYKGEVKRASFHYKGLPLDIKSGKGSYVVGPGSEHQSGSIYRASGLSIRQIRDLNYVSFDTWMATQSRSGKEESFTERIASNPIFSKGERNVGLTRALGAIARYNFDHNVLEQAAHAINASHCDPPLEDEEVLTCVDSATKSFSHDINLEDLTTSDEEYQKLIGNEMSARKLMEMELPDAIINDVWPLGAISVLAAQSGWYKSFIGLDLASRIADGRDLIEGDLEVPCARKTLYVIGEGTASYGKRIRAAGLQDTALRFQPTAVDLSKSECWDGLCEYIIDRKFEVVIFDTFQKNRGILNENDATEINTLYRKMENLHEYMKEHYKPVSFMFIHHAGKSLDHPYRGSSAITADATNVWTLTDKSEQELQVVLRSAKIRDLEPISLQVNLGRDLQVDSLYVANYSRDADTEPVTPVKEGKPYLTYEDVENLVAQIDTVKDRDGQSPFDYSKPKQFYMDMIKQNIGDKRIASTTDFRDWVVNATGIKLHKITDPETGRSITRWSRRDV